MRADVTITSGTVGSSGGERPTGGIQIQGPNLSISGFSNPGGLALLGVSPNAQTLTFNPNQAAVINGPGTSLVYNGTTYTTFVVAINLAGPLVTVPNAFVNPGPPTGSYQGSVSNVPFSMTGTVTIYAGNLQTPPILSVPISGSGLYSAFSYGNFLARGPGGIPQGGVTYQFAPGPALDTITQGAWNGKYGADGYMIANGATKLPSYAGVSVTGAFTYTWAGQTSDPRGLQNGAGATTGIASAFTQYPNNSFNVNVNMTDGNPHQVALYLLDWDTTTRSETITVTDVRTNTIIGTQIYANFHNGEYAVWNLQGNVNITVTPNGGGPPVMSGIFFGPGVSTFVPPANQASATYAGLDTATQGTWTGKYGANGYLIANGLNKAPTYGVASVAGATTYTWAGQTSDVRALQTSPGSTSRIASAYTQYANASYNINVNVTDGSSHTVSLYVLDWDSTGRSQSITIMDASSNAVLDSRSFSGFHNGQYASWKIKGNVRITVTPNGGSSPVVSGVFFN